MAVFANSVQVCLLNTTGAITLVTGCECHLTEQADVFTLKGKIYSGSVCLAGQTYRGSV